MPLILWLVKKDKSAFVNDQGKEALNFIISVTIGGFLLGIIGGILHLGILSWALWIYGDIMMVYAGIQAYNGVVFRHLVSLRLIK